MGWNTTVVVLNDYLHQIGGDADFGKNLARAIRRLSSTGGKPYTVAAGGAPVAAVVVETHDGYEEQGVIVGNNTGIVAKQALLRTKEIDVEEELLPCPFCGGGSYLSEQDGHPDRVFECKTYSVACLACGASGPWEKNPEGPVQLWNRRRV